MNIRLEEMKSQLEEWRNNKTATPEQIRELENMIRQLESLDTMEVVFRPVVENFEKLSSMPREKQAPQQKLWLLAYAHVDNKLKSGTVPAMIEVARLMPILYETIK